MNRILNPAENDADYIEMLTGQNPVTIEKKVTRGGSLIAPGAQKHGVLKNPLLRNLPVEFTDASQGNTSEVQRVNVNQAGAISFDTATSVYNLTSHAPDHRQKSLLYLRRGYLDFDDVMPDGFYDGGRHLTFKKDAKGTLIPQSPRELILVDSTKDAGLVMKLKKAQELLGNISDPKQKILTLAQFVANVLGGAQIVETKHGPDIVERSNEEITNFMKHTGGNTVGLGYLNYGVCRHRALLFKYLADRTGIRSRLIRGLSRGGHVWNIVEVNGQTLVVDVMKDPFKLYELDDPAIAHYRRTDGTGGIAGFRGGASIPNPRS